MSSRMHHMLHPHRPPNRSTWDASLGSPSKSRALFDPRELGIHESQRALFTAVNRAVREHMNNANHDPSHDYEHIQRVVSFTNFIYENERARNPDSVRGTNLMVMYLTAMMHDVGDPKYLPIGHTSIDEIHDILWACRVPLPLARQVEYLIPLVSFSGERRDRAGMQAECRMYTELRIIQDADRLDRLGAVGQGRCFVYGGADERRKEMSIHVALQLHRSRFQATVDWMKTETGKREPDRRWRRMRRFPDGWNEETDISAVLLK